MRTQLRRWWLLGLSLSTLLGATDAPAQESEPIRFSFSVYGLHPGKFEGLHYLNPEGDPVEIKFRRRHRSPIYECELKSPAEPLRFFRIRRVGDEVFYDTVAQVMPSAAWKEMLFLFQEPPNSAGSRSLRVFAAADDTDNFPYGSLRIINLTPIPLGGSIDQQTETIAPGKWTDAFQIRNEGNVDVLFAAATSQSVHLVYRRTMPLRMNSRTLLILRPPAREGSIRIGATTLQDFEAETEGP